MSSYSNKDAAGNDGSARRFYDTVGCMKSVAKLSRKVEERKKLGDPDIFLDKSDISELTGSNRNRQVHAILREGSTTKNKEVPGFCTTPWNGKR